MTIAGEWSQVEINGKLADVYEPQNRRASGEVIMHLHGHGLTTIKDNVAFSTELERHGFPAICPHGQRSWWLDVICDEFDQQMTPVTHLKEQIFPYIKERWDCEPPKIALMGISMGGQGVLQLSYREPQLFPVVAAISPAVDFHNWYGAGYPLDKMFSAQEPARQETVLLHIHPLNWPRHQLFVCDPADTEWFESSDRLAMKLSSSGISFETDFASSNGGHCWEYFDTMANKVVEFISQGMKAESRRVP